MNMKNPSEVIEYLLGVSIEKGNKPIFKLMILGFMAGVFIAIGGVGSILASSTLIKTDYGLGKFVAGAIFPVGLMMVLLLGVELFTSNTMIVIGAMDKRITSLQVLRNWLIVYVFNFLGTFFMAYITVETHTFNNDALEFLEKLAIYKTTASGYSLFLKGILCNILVCGGVLMAYAAKDVVGKIFAAWFSIMIFTVLGYDHCVANMLYLSAAKLGGVGITVSGIAHNLFYVTIGNIVGGTLFMAIPLYLSHYKRTSI